MFNCDHCKVNCDTEDALDQHKKCVHRDTQTVQQKETEMHSDGCHTLSNNRTSVTTGAKTMVIHEATSQENVIITDAEFNPEDYHQMFKGKKLRIRDTDNKVKEATVWKLKQKFPSKIKRCTFFWKKSNLYEGHSNNPDNFIFWKNKKFVTADGKHIPQPNNIN